MEHKKAERGETMGMNLTDFDILIGFAAGFIICFICLGTGKYIAIWGYSAIFFATGFIMLGLCMIVGGVLNLYM
jgi:hypothetical protein